MASMVAEDSEGVPTLEASAGADFTAEADLGAIAEGTGAIVEGMGATAEAADITVASAARQEALAAAPSVAEEDTRAPAAGLPVEGRGWAIAPQPTPASLMGGGTDSEAEQA